MNVLVSVIVPVFNTEKYLPQCIDSILAQTLKGIEIIIVDDGSTDMCPKIIDDYAKRYSNIVTIHQSQQGVLRARVAACRAASADYIGFVDSDDFVEPTMYEKLYKAAIMNNADFVGCDYSFYPEKVPNKEKWFKEYKGAVDWYFIERNTQSWNKIVSRELLDKTKALDLWEESGEGIYVKLLLHAKNIVMLPDELYHYRVGHNSISGGIC